MPTSRTCAACALSLSALLAFTMTACKSSTSGPSNVMLSGAGSTFINPAMTRWAADFQQSHSNARINYSSIGSGGGIQQVKAGTVDFGASDAALTDDQLKSMSPVIQIPESAGPVCITYNLPDLKQPLQLSGEALANIFLGKITTWKDPQIAKDNPGVKLPGDKILVAHRAESSGTTNIFTTYLSSVSPDWEKSVGKGTAVKWPVGLGGKGSEGVTQQVTQTPGAIGYVELTYAQQNKLPVASLKNQAGKYVAPTTAATTAAIDAFKAQLTSDPRQPIVNAPASAPDAYPIAGLTFLIIPKDGTDKDKRAMLKSFIQYVLGDGQQVAGSLNYAPLPDGMKQADLQAINQMTANGQPLQ